MTAVTAPQTARGAEEVTAENAARTTGEPSVRVASLSPSRAADFVSCPLRYRFRMLDQLPEPLSSAAVRGTLVHAVLERLFDLAADDRTVGAATALLPDAWESVLADEPDAAALAGGTDEARQAWFAAARVLVESYFALEDPTAFEPSAREVLVEHEVPSGPLLRGYVDRLDAPGDGRLRVVDYKTGRAPSPAFEQRALFQLKFYALVLWRSRGVLPEELCLLYLGDRQRLTYRPDADGLVAFEQTVRALSDAVELARSTGDFRPSPGRSCGWCPHQALCPAFGGTPPPLPARVTREAGS